MAVESLKEFEFDLSAYEKYLGAWLKGIRSELGHWRRIMETKVPQKRGWVSDSRKCDFEQYLEPREETLCLDVGSGPFSSSGDKTDKTNLKFTAVDPLAYSYKILKKKFNITTGITPEYCMVERLAEKFDENTFDIVHMKNALDHAFNPVFGIMQMIAVCKKGGKIILQHGRNVAEKENFHGFHQWNLCVENGDFVIWRRDAKYNVSKMLANCAEVIIEETPEEWVGVVLVKREDLEIDAELQRPLIRILNEKIFERLLECAVSEAYSTKENVISAINRVPVLGSVAQKIYRKCCR
jgi:SAM-dependent methyltransferase